MLMFLEILGIGALIAWIIETLRKRRLHRLGKGFGHAMQHDLDTPEAKAAIHDLTKLD